MYLEKLIHLLLLCLTFYSCQSGEPDKSQLDSFTLKGINDSLQILENKILQTDSIVIPELKGTVTDTLVAEIYFNLSKNKIKNGAFKEAFSYANDAASIYGKYSKVRQADSWVNMGNCFRKFLKPDSSLHYYKSAIKAYERFDEKQKISRTYLFWGYVLLDNADFNGAISVFEKALKIRLDLYGKEDIKCAEVYYVLGIPYDILGQYKTASFYFEESLKIYENSEGNFNNNIADIYNGLGINLGNQGELEKSIEYHKKALMLRIKIWNPRHSRVADSHMNLGFTYNALGNINKAIESYEKALKIRKLEMRSNHPKISDIYLNLSSLYIAESQYEKALNYLYKAQKIRFDLNQEEHPNTIAGYENFAKIYAKRKDYELAAKTQIKCIDILENKFGERHLEVALSYKTLGEIYQESKAFDKAINAYQKSSNILFSERNISLINRADILRYIGSVYLDKKDYKQALRYFKQSLAYFQAEDKPNPIKVSELQISISEVFMYLNQFDDAEYFYMNALSLMKDERYENYFSENLLVPIYKHGGLLFFKRYKSTGKEKYLLSANQNYKNALDFLNNKLSSFSENSDKIDFSSYAYPIIEGKLNVLLELDKSNNKKLMDDTEIFRLFESSKSYLLREVVSCISLNDQKKPNTIIEKEELLKNQLVYLHRNQFEQTIHLTDGRVKDSILNDFGSRIFELKQINDSIKNVLKNNHSDYYSLKYMDKEINVSYIQDSLLKSNQALIEYFVGDSSIFTFTILADTFFISKIKKDFPIENLVEDMLHGIYDPYINGFNQRENNEKYVKTASQIYQKLFAHIDTLIPSETELIIVPDGVLGYIPFDVLLVESPKTGESFLNYKYLLKYHQISYAYSATLLKEMRYRKHRKEPTKDVLAFAPSFDENSETGDTSLLTSRYIDKSNNRNWLRPLNFNDDEVNTIDTIMNTDVYLDSLATKDRFTSIAKDYRVIHLATHGKANDKVGDYSFLAFYDQQDSLDRGWLYNRELYNLELNADMVVLSACETGIGELQRGEGIISLARGFSYAGAKSIITTLWSVDDKSSQVLMKYFYKHLNEGKSKDAALRSAKLEYLENDAAHSGESPFFWAGFIPIGDMTPLELGVNWTQRIGYGSMAMLVLFGLFYFLRRRR